jgi:hypothetical protein
LRDEGYKTSSRFHTYLLKKAEENSHKVAKEKKLKSNNLFDKDKIREAHYQSIQRSREKMS